MFKVEVKRKPELEIQILNQELQSALHNLALAHASNSALARECTYLEQGKLETLKLLVTARGKVETQAETLRLQDLELDEAEADLAEAEAEVDTMQADLDSVRAEFVRMQLLFEDSLVTAWTWGSAKFSKGVLVGLVPGLVLAAWVLLQ